MRKALFPLIASLAVCGAATAALVATTARAEQSVRKPVMIALVAPAAAQTAAPAQEGGPPPQMDEAMMGREQFCKDLFARRAGELAFLEAKLSLSAKQTPLFERWKQASLDVARKHETDCAAHETGANGRRSGPVDRMAMEEDLLKKRLADIQAERPALTALYASLTPAQKDEFSQGDRQRMAGHMRMMLGMMGHAHPGMGPMGHGPMEHGPMGEAPPPPPAQ